MSDLLIKGMDLPKEGRVSLIAVFSDGDVKYIDRETFLSFRLPQKATEVPPHGRLIDEADLRDRAYKRQIRDRISFNDALVLALMDAPTIIEASTEETK